MKSSYGLALEKLSQIRKNNVEESARRRREVHSCVPRIAKIENELMDCGAELARCILNRNNDFSHIKEQIIRLQAERDNLLEQNGKEIDYLDELFTCKECKDTGFNGTIKCVCLKQQRIEQIAKQSNLTKFMRTQTFENFDYSLFSNDIKNIVNIAQNFANSFDENDTNLFIFGNVGTGKTFLSSCVANRAIQRGKTVYYQSAHRIFDMIQKSKNFAQNDNEELEETLKFIYSVDLVIIDDLGTEWATAHSMPDFFDIINSRLLDGKSTIINTNLSLSEVGIRYSERVASRIFGNYEIIKIEVGDLRYKLIERKNGDL